ncbi:VOC family protein [Natronorarus salvus]|uniref:VOC family protein n=1 Tax=Natronorarus salvus TaxID=3117733 RepID=UPI002F26A90D
MTSDETRTPIERASIDHVELFVPDREEAAAWYEATLGLTPAPELEAWAADGPLMLSGDDGATLLAVFEGEPTGDREPTGYRRVAFRVDRETFRSFVDSLPALPVSDADGEPIRHEDVVDHDLSHSIYFTDPYGNPFEVTTYEVDRLEG